MRPSVALALLALAAPAADAPPPAGPAVSADFVRPEGGEPLPAPLAAALAGYRSEAIAAHVAVLASPGFEGRGLGTRGVEAAGEYVAAQLALAGVPPLPPVPAARGALAPYFQSVPMREIREPGGTVELQWAAGGRSRTFLSGVDALVPAASARSLSAPAVFAGYGIRETSPARDDFAGLAVKGRFVVVREGVPPGAEWHTKEMEDRYAAEEADERWDHKVETARALGALGVIAVEGEGWAGRLLGRDKPWPFAFQGLSEGLGPAEPLLVRVSPAVGDALIGADDRPRDLPGVTITVRATGQERLAAGRNVIAFLEGADPGLRGEAVVIGAHYDHLGVVDGRIHPGADDNASGTSALLEIARVLAAAPRPRRSLVVCFWTGEEEAKIGSGYWVAHPRWPLARTVAYLNLDMIGHPWSAAEIEKLVKDAGLPEAEEFLGAVRGRPEAFVEPGVARFARDLGPVLVRAGQGSGLALHLDWTEGVSGGSDYRAFARARVPFVRFFGNFFPAYHQPGDTAEALDPAQVQRVGRLALATAWLLADRPRP